MSGPSIILLVAALAIAFADLSNSARILGFFPAPSKSHLIIHNAIAEALAEQGHNVTIFQTIPNFMKSSKCNRVVVDVDGFDSQFLREIINNPVPFYRRIGSITDQIEKHSKLVWAHPKTQQFLRDNQDSFDLLILGYFLNDYHLGLGAHFKCPVILSFTIQPIFGISRMLGNPMEVAYVPALFGGLKQPLNFMGRVQNFLVSMCEDLIMSTLISYRMNSIYESFFPPNRYPTLQTMYNNISLLLTNHHFSQGPIRPDVPAVISIGGIAIKEKPDPLPADIAQFIDNAEEGVIFFSFGSNVQGDHLAKEKTKIIFDVLSSLPYNVLWKWSDGEKPGEAMNILYKSWLPQDDILAHPNVKLFITHGGKGSIVESQYHGVPMVGIPLFGDQPSNMVSVEAAGFGLLVEYMTLSAPGLRAAILEVLQNQKYSGAVQKFSELYRDRPMTTRQTAVYWVEYVLRHRGARHLQSPVVHLNGWQRMSLDVIGFLLGIVAAMVAAVMAVWKVIVFYRRGRKNVDLSKSKTRDKKIK